MKPVLAAILLSACLLPCPAQQEEQQTAEQPARQGFDSPCLGKRPDDFKKVFERTKFVPGRWSYHTIPGDDPIFKAYQAADNRSNLLEITTDRQDQKIRGVFLRNECIAVIIDTVTPLPVDEVKTLASLFLPGVAFDFRDGISSADTFVTSASDEGKYVIRFLHRPEAGYSMELLCPTLANHVKSKTTPVKPKNGVFVLTDRTSAMKGNVRTVFEGPDKKRIAAMWKAPEDGITWSLNVPEDGTYTIEIKYGVTERPLAKMAIKAGHSSFNWTVTENESRNVPMQKAIAKVKLRQGNQPFSIELLAKDKETGFRLHEVRLTRDRSSEGPKSAAEEAREEMAYFKSMLEGQAEPQLASLKQTFSAKINELNDEYTKKNNFIAKTAIRAIHEHMDDLNILEAAENSIKRFHDQVLSKEDRDFKVDKSFLVGRWKDKKDDIEYEFRALGKVAAYKDGKRNLKAEEDSYSFSEREEIFTIFNKSGWHMHQVDILGEDMISFKGRQYERLKKEEED